MASPSKAQDHLLEQLQEQLTVALIGEDGLRSIASGTDVEDST